MQTKDRKKTGKRWILLGILMATVMAVGGFAMGEAAESPDRETLMQSVSTGAPSSPRVANHSNDTGAFIVTGKDLQYGNDYIYDSDNGILTILSSKEMTIRNQKPSTPTTGQIAIQLLNPSAQTEGAHLILAGVNIGSGRAALEITQNAKYNVNITLADGSENILKSGDTCAGLQKSGNPTDTPGLGTLTIDGTGSLEATGGKKAAGIGGQGIGWGYDDGSNINIEGGNVTATGGEEGGAGIGGGYQGSGSVIKITGGNVTATGGKQGGAGIGGGLYGEKGSDITISGGTVMATGGQYVFGELGGGGAGIGDGWDGRSASNNKLDGNAVVLAAGGSDTAPALDGFDLSTGLTQGIAFTRKGTSRLWDAKMYGGSVAVTADATFPAALTVASGNTLTVNPNVTLGLDATLTIDGTLQNEGTMDSTKISCGTTGKVTTQVSYIEDVGNSMASIDPKVIIYKENGDDVKPYTSADLPTPAPKAGYTFQNWCSDSAKTKNITVGTPVQLDEHLLFAKWGVNPKPGPTPGPTPGPSVDPGSGGSNSAKTGDPFAGGIALALLGAAAVAGIALKKRK